MTEVQPPTVAEGLAEGLRDAIAYTGGDKTRGRETTVNVPTAVERTTRWREKNRERYNAYMKGYQAKRRQAAAEAQE